MFSNTLRRTKDPCYAKQGCLCFLVKANQKEDPGARAKSPGQGVAVHGLVDQAKGNLDLRKQKLTPGLQE